MWHVSKLEPPFSSRIASISKSTIKHCQTVCFRGFSFCDTWSISWHYWMSDKSLNYGRTALAAASPECQFCSCLGAGQMFQDNLVPAQYGRNWRSQLSQKVCIPSHPQYSPRSVAHFFERIFQRTSENLKSLGHFGVLAEPKGTCQWYFSNHNIAGTSKWSFACSIWSHNIRRSCEDPFLLTRSLTIGSASFAATHAQTANPCPG